MNPDGDPGTEQAEGAEETELVGAHGPYDVPDHDLLSAAVGRGDDQRLGEQGWATGAAIANSVIYGAESAFDPGFDFFAGLLGEGNRRTKLVDADVVVDTGLEWLKSRLGLPSFLYVHTMDPHVPYGPPPPFDRMFEPHPTEEHPARDPRTDYLEPLDREHISVEYMYAFTARLGNRAVLVFRFDDLDAAITALTRAAIEVERAAPVFPILENPLLPVRQFGGHVVLGKTCTHDKRSHGDGYHPKWIRFSICFDPVSITKRR